MNTGKLKISVGDLNVVLEGDNDLLYRSFSDLRTDGSFYGSGVSLKSIESRSSANQQIDEAVVYESSAEAESKNDVIEIRTAPSTADLPDFNSLILERKTFTVSTWMLFMAWSVSHKGRIKFSKKQLKKIYNNSCKHIGLRQKDFLSNFMLLLLNDYISMVEKNTFTLTDVGFNQAYALLTEANNSAGLSEAI